MTDTSLSKYPTLNSADYCRVHNLLTLEEEQRFDIYLPNMFKNHKYKVSTVDCKAWLSITYKKLMMRLFYLNKKFGESWTYNDFVSTLNYIIRNNIESSEEYFNSNDYKKLRYETKNYWDLMTTRTYEERKKELAGWFMCSKRQYKVRNYRQIKVNELIESHLIDNTVRFADREELKNICDELNINFYRTVKDIESQYKLVFNVETDARVKYNVEGMTLDEFNKYCKEHNINKVTKSRLKKKFRLG